MSGPLHAGLGGGFAPRRGQSRLDGAHHRLLAATVLMFSLLALGTGGYHFIEGWSWFDALHHAVITLAPRCEAS